MMNFSNSMKPPHKRRGTYWRDLVLGFIVGALVALLIGLAVSRITTTAKADQDFPAETPADSSPLWTVDPSPVETPTEVPATTPPQTLFRVTAYCACEKCCGEWAKNRPNGVVYGAAGIELIAGVSAASPLPLGTVVEVEGLGEYVVQDRPAKWVIEKYGENQLDIYFDNHEEACAFGLQYLNVYIKEEPK